MQRAPARWVVLLLVAAVRGQVDGGEGGGGGAAGGGQGRNPGVWQPDGQDALQYDHLPSNACLETAQGTSRSNPADNAACRAVIALDDDAACLRVMKAAAPSDRACSFVVNVRAHAACEDTIGGWIGFELGHGFDPMCVDQFVLLCSAVTVLLCLVCAWVTCCRRGTGRDAHKDHAVDGSEYNLENARLAAKLEADLMTPKWPSPMQPSRPASVALVARLESTGHESGMFPARCVRLMAPQQDYDSEVLGFSDGTDRAKVVSDHLAAEVTDITIVTGDVVIVEDRSDSHWWQGYIETAVEDKQGVASSSLDSKSDTMAAIRAARGARKLRARAMSSPRLLEPEPEPEREQRRKPDTGVRISVQVNKLDSMSIHAAVPTFWCPAPRVLWHRVQGNVQERARFVEGLSESSQIGSGLTYKIQKQDHKSFIGCSLACGCKHKKPTDASSDDYFILDVDSSSDMLDHFERMAGTAKPDAHDERGDYCRSEACNAPLFLLEEQCLCRNGWLGLGLYDRDGTVAKDPFALIPKREG